MSTGTFSTTPTTDRPWVHEMVVIHRVFRREFTLLPRLVREVADGDTDRAAPIAEALRLVLDGLHHHHSGEDDILWPALLERAAPSTGLVETMQAQHGVVDGYAEQAVPLLGAWERTASSSTGTELADVLDRFAAALFEHLDLEEREILPLASRHVTAAEWNQMGEHGKDSMSPSQLPIMFGLVLEDADDEERATMLGNLPLPIRLLLRTIGAWQFRRYVRRLRAS